MHDQFEDSVRNDIRFGGEASELVDAAAAGTLHREGQEFKDFRISPSDVREVQFFRYRKRGFSNKLIEYIRLVLPSGEEAQLHDITSKNQFVSRLGLKISDLRKIYDYNERNALLGNACKGRTEPVIFRAVRNNGVWFAYAVVTDRFTEVRHVEVWKIVESEIQKQGLVVQSISELRTPKRFWKTYLFESQIGRKVGDVIQVGLRVCNSVKGTSSVIIYPYWIRLACTNGMTSSQGVWKPATTHVGEKHDILQSVKFTLKEALEQAFGYEKLMAQAVDIKLDNATRLRLLKAVVWRKNFSQAAFHSIKLQLEQEHSTSLWSFVNAITYTATHEVNGAQTSITMQQTAHSLLRGGHQSVDELIKSFEAELPQPQTTSSHDDFGMEVG